MFAILLIILITILLILYIYIKLVQLKLNKNIIGPPLHPIFGNGLKFLGKTAHEILCIVTDDVIKYGKTVRFWFGPELCVLISDPKDVEAILSSKKLITKSIEYGYLSEWLGDGLLLSTGRKWSTRRKAMTPAFHFKILEQFLEIFERQADILIENLKKVKSNEIFDLYPVCTLYALDVICESAMGVTVNAQRDFDSEYVEAIKVVSNIIHLRIFNVLLRSDFVFRLSSNGRKQRKAVKILHDFTDKVITERRSKLIESIKNPKVINEDVGIKTKMVFLDVLLQATIDGKPLTDSEIREEVDTFMFEGHDTTTSGIAFTLYNIAKYPDVQQKILEEVCAVLGKDSKKSNTTSDFNNLNYLDLVIKESLRLFPSVPIIGRKTLEDTLINNKLFPANSNLIISNYHMSRHADVFPDPYAFIPERFSGEKNSENTNPYSYVPFSAGPRNCIGQKFAVYELKCVISKIVRNFELTLCSDVDCDPKVVCELILRPINGVQVKIKPRDLSDL